MESQKKVKGRIHPHLGITSPPVGVRLPRGIGRASVGSFLGRAKIKVSSSSSPSSIFQVIEPLRTPRRILQLGMRRAGSFSIIYSINALQLGEIRSKTHYCHGQKAASGHTSTSGSTNSYLSSFLCSYCSKAALQWCLSSA